MKIQNQLIKIVFTFALCMGNMLHAEKVCAQQQNNQLLQQADSLFAAQQYTESSRLYEQLYQQEEVASPAMLLRMAFIQEGLGDYSQSLYYLNEYYLMTYDEEVLSKITTLSEEYNLRGYEFSDIDYIRGFLKQYQYLFIFLLIAVAMVGLAYFVLKGKKYETKPIGFGVSYLLILSLLFYLTNFSPIPSYGIIVDNNTYLMTAPSAGSDVLIVIPEGHRVKVAGWEDIWAKIEWDGQIAYVREDNLRLLKH
jgi:hypothetical protein